MSGHTHSKALLDLVQSNAPLQRKLTELLRLSAEASGSSMGGIWLLDDRRRELRAAVTLGLPDDYAAIWQTLPVGTGVCGVVVQTGVPDFVEDMASDPRFADNPCSVVRSGISVPIRTSTGEIIGTLGNHFPRPYRPTTHHIERNQVFATLIAAAIEAAGSSDRSVAAD